MIVPPEIIEKLIAIEKSTTDNEKAIQEIRKELEKPVVDWCIGMWVKNIYTGEKAFIRNVASCFGCGELYGCYLVSLQKDVGWVDKNQLKDWTPIPYPYQEFLKVGDRVEWNGRKGTIIKIDGTVTPIKVLFDENIGSSSWYEIQQLTKIGEAK